MNQQTNSGAGDLVSGEIKAAHTATPRRNDLEEQILWAERHASDLTIAEHNRAYFAGEVVRLRAALATLAAAKA